MTDLRRMTREFLLGERQAPSLASYLQSIAEVLDLVTPRSQRDEGRIDMAKKNLKEVEENRQSLIYSGLSLLTQKGFEATGLDEITKNAGLPKGSFYVYYDSKELFGLALIDA